MNENRTGTFRERWLFLWGLGGLAIGLWWIRQHHYSPFERSLLVLLFAAAPMILIQLGMLRAHENPSAGLSLPVSSRKWNFLRSLVKWMGLTGSIGMVLGLYWLFPEYSKDFYRPFQQLGIFLPGFLILSFPYILWIDRRMEDPHDGYWHSGCLFIGRWSCVDGRILRAHALGWLVKAFYLPLMVVFLNQNLDHVLRESYRFENFMNFFHCAWNHLLLLDVLFACMGYFLTVRALDAHIRSTEPTFSGWFVGLVCYQPIWNFFGSAYFSYRTNMSWEKWLAGEPVFQVIWGSLILILTAFYAWATLVFGLRFSNLTHRGILAHGPYRWFRHPAYVSKNLSWWLIDIPFLAAGGWMERLRHVLLLLMLNGIYALRAWTEERHLSRDPEYVQYREWVRRNGLVGWFRRLLNPKRAVGVDEIA